MRDALESLPGVAEVVVDFELQLAVCRVNSKEFQLERALDVLAEAGYPEARVVEKDELPDAPWLFGEESWSADRVAEPADGSDLGTPNADAEP